MLRMYTNFTATGVIRSYVSRLLLMSISRLKFPRGKRSVQVRSKDQTGRDKFAKEITNINWTSLYRMTKCNEMTNYFTSTHTSILDECLPVRNSFRHTGDKPWATDEFRRIIRCRQFAFNNGNSESYKIIS